MIQSVFWKVCDCKNYFDKKIGWKKTKNFGDKKLFRHRCRDDVYKIFGRFLLGKCGFLR